MTTHIWKAVSFGPVLSMHKSDVETSVHVKEWSVESRRHVALGSLPFKMKLFVEKNGWWLVRF